MHPMKLPDGSDPKYTLPHPDAEGRLVARGALKRGVPILDQVQKDFEMVGATAADMFAAEKMSGVGNHITFNAAMLCQQLRKLGTYEGPFTLGVIGKLHDVDYNRLREAQLELEILGEA